MIRNFLLNKLMHADYDVYEWIKNILRIEHAPENPFQTQVDHDDREHREAGQPTPDGVTATSRRPAEAR